MIYYFNPGHEIAVHNASAYYMSPSNVKVMQQELCFLVAWYAKSEGLVLVDAKFDFTAIDNYYQFFPQLPRAVKENQIAGNQIVNFWGISPQVIHFFQEINRKYNLNLLVPKWKEEYTLLNSRLTAKDCLESLIRSITELDSLSIPEFYNSLSEIEDKILSSNYSLLAKAPYSSSGRGLLWLPQGKLPQSERQILQGIINKQGHVSVEKALNKQIDFAMEFLSDGNGHIHFEGYSLFQTNAKGAYQGNILASQDYIDQVLTNKISSDLLDNVKANLISILKEKFSYLYEGCLGVDMFIYLENNEYKLHPCVEINMRYNMGFLSVCFCNNYLHPKSTGIFKVDFNKNEGCIYLEHTKLLEERPAIFKDHKISSGYLPLCPVSETSHYWAYVLID